MSEDYKDKFPEKWVCPYCVGEVTSEERCTVERDDIPSHLVFKHEWDGNTITWKYIFERLSAVGGV